MRRFLFIAMAVVLLAGVTVWYVHYYLGGLDGDQPRSPWEILQPRAEKGDIRAQYELGLLYLTSEKRRKPDYGEAYRWLKKAADTGHVPSRYALAGMIERGKGVKQDYRKAAEFYRQAASLGNYADAQFSLGQLYFDGRGVAHDYSAAFDWYTRAANQNHAAAQYLIGSMYAQGWGIKRDPIEAYKWLTLALPNAKKALAISSRYDPRKAREKLLVKMTKFQISRAEQRIKEWRSKYNK